MAQAQIDRVAISDALVEHGHLPTCQRGKGRPSDQAARSFEPRHLAAVDLRFRKVSTIIFATAGFLELKERMV